MPKTSREESLTLEIRLTSSALSHSFHIRKVFNPFIRQSSYSFKTDISVCNATIPYIRYIIVRLNFYDK